VVSEIKGLTLCRMILQDIELGVRFGNEDYGYSLDLLFREDGGLLGWLMS
jgi:hypothetical protein